MNVGFERLRTLVLVHRHGSLAAAARVLGVTPSAVSQQLSALEREADGEVLLRRGRGVELTPLGEVLAEGGRRVLAELERTAASAERLRGTAAGPYAIAALPTVALTIVTRAVAALGRDHAELDLAVTDAETAAGLDRLAAQEIDLALVDRYDDDPLLTDPLMVVHDLGREPLVLLVPESFPRPAGPVALRRLADQPWVLAPEGVGCGDAARRACRRAGFDPLVRWESNDVMVLRESVAAGLGVTLLPRLALVTPPAGTAVVPVRGVPLERSIVAVTRSATAARPVEQAVLAALRSAAAELLPARARR